MDNYNEWDEAQSEWLEQLENKSSDPELEFYNDFRTSEDQREETAC